MTLRKHQNSRNPGRHRLGVEPLEDRRLLAALTVNSRFDNGTPGDNMVTLREAIDAANNDTTTDLGETGNGADTIRFDPIVFGPPLSVRIFAGQIEITETLTIDALDRPELTIETFNQSRLFYISATAGDVTLAGLTLEDGRTEGDGSTYRGGSIHSQSAGLLTIDQSFLRNNSTSGDSAAGGGAIFAAGPLMITNSTIESNSTAGVQGFGGAIMSLGTVTISQSTVSGNSTAGQGAAGGAIYAAAGLSVVESTISDNQTEATASRGGGIFSGGAATFTRSTVSGNSTLGNQSKSGGIHSADALTLIESTVSGNVVAGDFSRAGGVYSAGNMTIYHSTLSGNATTGQSSDGGAIQTSADLTITHSTITANSASDVSSTGGGIQSFGTNVVSITNSIVAGNSASGGLNDIDPGYSTLNIDFSLIEDTAGLTINGAGNVTGMEPMLGPLADNGGLTETHAVLIGSPAMDAGDPSVLPGTGEFDQRGSPFVRVIDGDGANGARIDMGSYEQQSFNFVVDTLVDEFDGDYSAGDLSLREVLASANASAGVDTITFDPALFSTPQTMVLALGQIEITDAVTIEGPGQQLLTIDAQQQSRIFNIVGTGLTTLSRMALVNGRETDSGFFDGGGAVRSVNGRLNIIESTISGNSSSSCGGGIFAYRNITLTDSTVHGNDAQVDGGGVFTTYGRVTLNGSTVSGNVTGGDGGGIYSYRNAVLNGSFVTGNTAGFDGGGVYTPYGDVELNGSTVTGNVATTGNGGGVSAYYDVILTSSIVSGNSSGSLGGGIYAIYDVDVTESTVSGNNAMSGGGAYSANGGMVLTQSTFSGNTAASGGGGLLTAHSVARNSANSPANSSAFSMGMVSLYDSTVSGNLSLDAGAGIRSTGPVFVSGSTVTDNIASAPDAFGGGIWTSNYPATITNSVVAGNSAGFALNDINVGAAALNIDFSLIEDIAGLIVNGGNNITGVDPQLGPLTDNGGPTFTHALLPGSPAIDAGDSSIAVDPMVFDQRGAPFIRVVDGNNDSVARIDMGSFEAQVDTALACDFDGDDDCDIDDIDALIMEIVAGTNNPQFDLTNDAMVDLEDRDEWLLDAGSLNLPSGNAYLLGDSNLDGIVDGQDFIIWNSNRFTSTGRWSQADWNADGATDGQDFIIWNNNRFQSSARNFIRAVRGQDTRYDSNVNKAPGIHLEELFVFRPF